MLTDTTILVNEAQLVLEETIPTEQISFLPTSADMLESLVEESVRQVLSKVSPLLLTGVLGLGNQIFREDDGTGYIQLPDDFFRLLEFRMSDWKRSVYRPLDTNSEEFLRQTDTQSPWRGSPDFPAVAILKKLTGNVLKFWSCNNELARIETFLYLPLPYVDDDGRIDIPPQCRRAVVYEMARRFAALRCDDERTAMLENLLNDFLRRFENS